ncbi:amino acid ABC transporter permease [Vibrio viridaestus]|uniref:Amino acid ABC transporter permease n=1 Tax=Vibrio viridaestus TaxID=2487322 RepID=A0A3N9U1G6_9VIBR|nr:amino acid ABC transporter permease [Vibrio viridaestus]RQW63322.1 amino acid ABC transporter permease [Vibrio viridaestus]
MLDFSILPSTLPILWDGVKMTLFLSFMAVFLGLLVGMVMCALRMSPNRYLQLFVKIYVSVFRGVPLLVQLMVAYYCLPLIGIKVPALVAATACIGMCAGAYMTEILRGGFQSLPVGQSESAQMLGMTRMQVLLHVELPQVFKLTIPGLVNETILLVKASSLISAIGIAELTRTAQNLAASNFQPFEFYLTAAAMYFVLNSVISILGLWLEKRAKHGVAA